MTLRSQTIALVGLFVALAVVFVLVGNAGVSTGVFLPEPTVTYTPTVGPSPTPVPEGTAGNWTEVGTGQLSYAGTGGQQATIQYQMLSLADFVASSSGLQLPPDGTALPELDVLTQIRDQIKDQMDQLGLVAASDTFTGPLVEKINGIPVTLFRFAVGAQPRSDGNMFNGTDTALILIPAGDQYMLVQYQLPGPPDATVYNDFLAWLGANAADLVATVATPTPAAAEFGTPTEPAATPEATETSATPEATEAAPTAEESATPEPTTAAAAVPSSTNRSGDWAEAQPGQWTNTANPNAIILYNQSTVPEFAQNMGVDVPDTADTQAAIDTLLQSARDQLQAQIDQLGISVDAENFVGPQTDTVNDVPVSYIHIASSPETLSDGTANQMQELAIAMIDIGDGQIRVVNLIYQGEPDEGLFNSFMTWIGDNIALLTTPDAVVPTAVPETPTPAPGG